jgi:hypothetical protein
MKKEERRIGETGSVSFHIQITGRDVIDSYYVGQVSRLDQFGSVQLKLESGSKFNGSGESNFSWNQGLG